jgi:ATPase subunit of ABC transporter with duplicated ATPase domains
LFLLVIHTHKDPQFSCTSHIFKVDSWVESTEARDNAVERKRKRRSRERRDAGEKESWKRRKRKKKKKKKRRKGREERGELRGRERNAGERRRRAHSDLHNPTNPNYSPRPANAETWRILSIEIGSQVSIFHTRGVRIGYEKPPKSNPPDPCPLLSNRQLNMFSNNRGSNQIYISKNFFFFLRKFN